MAENTLDCLCLKRAASFEETPYQSLFLNTYIPIFLKRYSVSAQMDDSCIDYLLYNKEKESVISKEIVISHAKCSQSLYVSKFYPEIFREAECKYLSAACFYFIVHKSVQAFGLKNFCGINLESERKVFDDFYHKLTDFDFRVHYNRPSERVCVRGFYKEIQCPYL